MSNPPLSDQDPHNHILALDEAAEEIIPEDDGDHHMDSDPDPDSDGGVDAIELTLTNDSKAYFDKHCSPIFAIASHPHSLSTFLSGGGDDAAYIWTCAPDPNNNSDDANVIPREARQIAHLAGHQDSVSAAVFLPSGAYAVTAGLDGRVRVYSSTDGWKVTDEVQEVEEVNWIAACPTGDGDLFAVGAGDGSVWVYAVRDVKMEIVHVGYSHTASCTAGVWTNGGGLLATVSEDGSFNVWDVTDGNVRTVVALTAADQRFTIEGGLYSVAVSPSGSVAVVGGATGEMRVVRLPHAASGGSSIRGGKRTTGRPQPGGGGSGSTGGGQAGQILATLHTHTESVESLSFHPTQPLLASAGVDGKIVIYDAAHGYRVRRTMGEGGGGGGHTDAVVKVEFVDTDGWILTSCGVDGTVRRWDVRTGTELGCWRGHLGGNASEGEGGVLGFVQTKDMIVTAGDDGVALVFEVTGPAASGGVMAPAVGAAT